MVEVAKAAGAQAAEEMATAETATATAVAAAEWASHPEHREAAQAGAAMEAEEDGGLEVVAWVEAATEAEAKEAVA